MKLYLVRHGQSTGNVDGSLMGQSDHPLTELGEAQARAAAAWLAPHGPMPVYCSDLPRALTTAAHVAATWAAAPASEGAAAGLAPDARLREINLGDYEGRPWQEFDADEALSKAFAADPYGTVLPHGESLAHLEKRVMTAVHEILVAHGVSDGESSATEAVATSDASALATGLLAAQPGENACIVAHDGPVRAILNHYLGVPSQKWWTLSTTHGGVSLIEFAAGYVTIRYVNATGHLAGLEAGVYVPESAATDSTHP